jgi:hypothetical protein
VIPDGRADVHRQGSTHPIGKRAARPRSRLAGRKCDSERLFGLDR